MAETGPGPRCLMLDVDGVLIHPRQGGSWAGTIAQDLRIDPEALQRVFFRPHWPAILSGQEALDEVLARCLPSLRRDLTVADFLDYWFSRDAQVDAAVLAACDSLRAEGWRVFLATNQEPLRARYLMEELRLAPHVDGMLFSAGLGVAKPQAAFFARAQAAAEVPREAIRFVDDTPANVRAAMAAGWDARLWQPGADLREMLRDW
ncbi:HAD-IA family hydrolase [Pseudooceanicola nanhaiensis]|uniref:HAD-IA family hydrolase n=1 Tax=Pseudooceanicola nanhaiensis TaxID=375761 RepID=UPI001CD643A1|nr:HAD-IA family hydrolase [Pseudooceanicola nanhaiensis]MCA0921867.1 HAD-IA family hydrolase [Pseudooceanicola nanhaiensis]